MAEKEPQTSKERTEEAYESPAVEKHLTKEDLEKEFLYAGSLTKKPK